VAEAIGLGGLPEQIPWDLKGNCTAVKPHIFLRKDPSVFAREVFSL
jgi:hypothetical protein